MAVVSARLTGIPPAYLTAPDYMGNYLRRLNPDAFVKVRATVMAGETLLLEFFDVPSAIAARQHFLTSPLLFEGGQVAVVEWSIPDALFDQLQSSGAKSAGPVPSSPPPPPATCANVSTAHAQYGKMGLDPMNADACPQAFLCPISFDVRIDSAQIPSCTVTHFVFSPR
jgi:hypothetical protein